MRAHIAPILQSNVLSVMEGQKADLDLRSLESILAGSENGRIIEKGAQKKFHFYRFDG